MSRAHAASRPLFWGAWLALAGCLLCNSCREAAAPSAPRLEYPDAVAVVAGTPITVAALQAELKRRFRSADGPLSAEQKLAALDPLIRNETLYARARMEAFEQTPEMQARIRSLIIGHFKERQLARLTNAVTEQEIETYYQANAEHYGQPGAVRGAVIFLPVPAAAAPEKRDELRQQAEAVLVQARQATDDQAFARVVLSHSADQATRYRGGDWGWLTSRTDGVNQPLFQALATLETPGQFAPLVATPSGFYVAKLLEKRAPTQRSLAEVKEAIRYQLTRAKAERAEHDVAAAAKSGLDIQINRALVESISGPATIPEPPALPAGTTAQFR